MKIAHLSIKNFLKLKDIDMNPSSINVIVGKNKQGKTSILKAIRAAFTGDADVNSIRIGEGKAEITVELDDLNIKRTITEKGNYLDISNKQGMKMPAPQKFLDGILGTFSFNPIEFFDKKPIERKKYLLNALTLRTNAAEIGSYTGEMLAGLDYEGTHALEIVEQVRKHYYDQRTVANAEVTKKEKVLQELTSKIPQDFDPNKVTEQGIKDLRAAIEKDEKEAMKAEANQKELKRLQADETDLVAQAEAIQAKLKTVRESIVECAKQVFEYSDPMALEAAKDTLAALESKRELVFTAHRADEVRSELSEALKTADRLDGVVKRLTKEVPQDLIKKANLPIDGLTIDGDNLLINGVSLDNLSSSEQMKFGIQVAKALNGEFKIMCVDGLEALDAESFEQFLKEVEGDDYQLFVTRVDGNSPHSITIEDGEIKK